MVAKRGSIRTIRYEARVYDLLAMLPLAVPLRLGMAVDASGRYGWLFVEDVGDRPLDLRRYDHRRLAARWLAALHASAETLCAGDNLSDRTAQHYRTILRATRGVLLAASLRASFRASERRTLSGVALQLDRLEEMWDVPARDSQVLNPTLVHADFVSKNVRLRCNDGATGPSVLPFDWASAGFGSPAIDLWDVDVGAYHEALGSQGDASALRRVARAGRAFWLVLLTSWAAREVVSPWPQHALCAQLPCYGRWLAELTDALSRDRS